MFDVLYVRATAVSQNGDECQREEQGERLVGFHAGQFAKKIQRRKLYEFSPGGTTEAALKVLLGPKGLNGLVARAVAAANKRAGELAS